MEIVFDIHCTKNVALYKLKQKVGKRSKTSCPLFLYRVE